MPRTKSERAKIGKKPTCIPPGLYFHSDSGFEYVTYPQIEAHHTDQENQKFDEWIAGQGCPVVNGECCVFVDDYERWLFQGRPAIRKDRMI